MAQEAARSLHSSSPQPSAASTVIQNAPSQSDTPKTSSIAANNAVTNGPASRSGRPTIRSCVARYGMPSQMVASALAGLLAALGHHLYYLRLHGQHVQDSDWPVRFGIALSFFVKVALAGSVEIAYKQQIWRVVKKRSLKISTLDALFSICYNPFAFTHVRVLFDAWVSTLIALLVWCIPLSAIASPSTLTIRDGYQAYNSLCHSVPFIDFSCENGFGLTSDDQERAGMSYWTSALLEIDDPLYVYDTPSAELERIFRLSILSYDGPLKPSSPCSSVESCTYSLQLDAPAYQCEERQEFGGFNSFGYERSQLEPDNLLYASYSSLPEAEGGKPLAWGTDESAPDYGVFTEIPSLWVGWITGSSAHESHIVECPLYNATLSYEITFSGDTMLTNRTGVELHSLLLPSGTSKRPEEGNYQQFSGYHAAAYLFRAFLGGNLTWDPIATVIDETAASQTNLFEQVSGYPIEDDLGRSVENRFDDFILSMISTTQLHSQVNLTMPCSITDSVLLWRYEPFWLVLSYSLAVGFTLVVVTLGGHCFYKNGYSMDTTFSSFVTTTRSKDLDKLSEGHSLGQWPMLKDISEAKIKFGSLADPAAEHAAFAFPSSVDSVDLKKYL
ncbi:hypothetical protein F4778DRAFT_712103 [Xylariomycetidae sp. FL2044]|nr:hypothetical protein F4778DRAFT_712103 [Xylariomycetidae sp. FL2044]